MSIDTYKIIAVEAGRRNEKWDIVVVEAILPSDLTVYDHTIVPTKLSVWVQNNTTYCITANFTR